MHLPTTWPHGMPFSSSSAALIHQVCRSISICDFTINMSKRGKICVFLIAGLGLLLIPINLRHNLSHFKNGSAENKPALSTSRSVAGVKDATKDSVTTQAPKNDEQDILIHTKYAGLMAKFGSHYEKLSDEDKRIFEEGTWR